MKMQRITMCAVMLLALLPWATAQTAPTSRSSDPAIFTQQSNGVRLIALDGEWRFHAGDDPHEEAGGRLSWAQPGFDDSHWRLLRSDAPWTEQGRAEQGQADQGHANQGLANLTGYGWYRFRVTVSHPHPPLGILLPPFSIGYQVFADGLRIGSSGSYRQTPIPLVRTALVHSRVFPLPTTPDASGEHTYLIAIRVWAQPSLARYYFAGPARGGALVGAINTLQQMQERRKTQELYFYTDNFAFGLLAMSIALFSLGLYWFRRTETEYLWFALVPVMLGLEALLNIAFVVQWQILPLWDLVSSATEIGAQISLLIFVSRILGSPLSRARRVLITLGALSILTVPLYWTEVVAAPIAGWIGIMMLLPVTLWVVWKLAVESVHGNVLARVILLPIALMTGLSILDDATQTLAQFHLIDNPLPFEKHISLIGFHMHPMILVQTLFLLAMMAFLIDRFTRARRREERLVTSMEAARHVQRLLLPQAMPQLAGVRLESVYHPAEMVGGDFFLALPTDNSGLILLLGDVSGKGLPASMLVATLIGSARTLISVTADPASILDGLNTTLLAHHTGHFATCLICHISPDGLVTLASAGHPAPYRNGVEVPLPGALPLGMIDHADYTNQSLTLADGDRLVLISDGVLEAQDAAGQLLGFDAVQRIASMDAQAIAEAAIRHGQEDDITVLTATRIAAAR